MLCLFGSISGWTGQPLIRGVGSVVFVYLFVCFLDLFVCLSGVLILFQLRLDGWTVDKESRFSSAGEAAAEAGLDRFLKSGQNGFRTKRTRVQVFRTKQVADGRCLDGRMWQQLLLPWLTFRP